MNLKELRTILEIKRQWRDTNLLKKVQEEQLEKMFQAASETEYYKHLFESPVDSLSDFPITEKNKVRDNPDSFIRNGINKQDLKVLRTSGSSGKPMKIYSDMESSLFRKCLDDASALEKGRSPLDVIARIEARGYYQKPRFDSKFGLFRNIFFHVNEDIGNILSIMRKKKVDGLGGYPSMIYLIAKANMENPIKLKSAICGAEMLTKDYRKTIEESFSCPVFNMYGCWEFGPLGWECPEEHSLHINTNSVILEIVDSKGNAKNSGLGEVVLTSLRNTTMPLIRYKIGDLASWGKECSCGRSLPVLKSIEGRCDDMITLPSGRKITPMKILVEYRGDIYKGISEYQIIQERPDLFVVKVIPTKDGFKHEKEMIDRIKEACLNENVTIEIEIVDKIQKIGTKQRRVISKVKIKN
ncbi:hypothetical protein KKE92_02675 [Candidatus Micrarchaeota archaeon]|nr:hypothetical protein [Candidatus Micrarchaeota archaeon]